MKDSLHLYYPTLLMLACTLVQVHRKGKFARIPDRTREDIFARQNNISSEATLVIEIST
jgi:hypothetical protein